MSLWGSSTSMTLNLFLSPGLNVAHPEVLFDTVCLVEVQKFLGSLTQLGGLRELV